MFISESCFFQAINFRFTRTKRLQPATYLSATCDKVPQIHQLSYQPHVLDEVFSLLWVSRHIYTSGILEQLSISVYAHTMAKPGSGLDFSQHLKLSLFVFTMPKGFQLYGVFRSDNLEKSDRKSILS